MSEAATQRFPRADTAVPKARAFVGRTLADWHVSERTDDVLLCVSELATNAVRHGVQRGEHFLVKLTAADGCLRVEVHDTNRRRPRVQQPSTQDTTGRGLLLVEALADAWGVEPHPPRGKVVWSEFKIETVQATAVGARPC